MTSYDPSLYEPAYTLLQMIKNIEKYLKDNPQAAGIQNVEIDENNHLIVTLTDGTIIDAGEIDAGAGVVVDAALSDTSTNPVQNKVVKAAIDAKMTNPMNAAADLIVGGADGAPQRLGKGTAGQVLTMNDGATAPVWKTPQSGGMTNPMTAHGDMIVGGVDGDPVRIAKGTAQQILRMNSAGTLPEWTTPPSYVVNPMTAEGDLIVGGASSGNPIRLGKGTAGQVLKMNAVGTLPEWGNAGGGGGGKYLHTIQFTVYKAPYGITGCLTLINQSATAIKTAAELHAEILLKDSGFYAQASGYYAQNTSGSQIIYLLVDLKCNAWTGTKKVYADAITNSNLATFTASLTTYPTISEFELTSILTSPSTQLIWDSVVEL